MGSPTERRNIRFGVFELNVATGELLKNGRRIPVERQPFLILALLAEHPGEVVGRDQLRSALWPDGTFVDFDRGLNVAVKKLRDALGDSSDNPRFIETRLMLHDQLRDLIGKLYIDWGPGARAWVQRADRQNKTVTELRTTFKEPPFPGFLNFLQPLSSVDKLPQDWITALRATRGVYLLTCPTTDSVTAWCALWERETGCLLRYYNLVDLLPATPGRTRVVCHSRGVQKYSKSTADFGRGGPARQEQDA